MSVRPLASPEDSSRASIVRRLAGGVSLYLLARAAAGAIRLLTVPIIVHSVSATAYGTLATLWIPLLVVHGICDMGMGTAAVRFAPECDSASERRSLFATMLAARVVAGALVTAVIVAVHEPLALWLTGSPDNGRAFLWLALARPVTAVFDGMLDELRARGAMTTVSLLALLSATLVSGLSVVFVLMGLELQGLVWGRTLGEVLVFVSATALCFRFIRGRPTLANFRRLIVFGWPFGVLFVLSALRGVDRIVIRSLTSMDDVAGYELAMRLVGPVGLFNIALGIVLEPFVYAHARSSETPRFVDLFVRGYVAVFGTVAMALAVVGPEAIALFAPEAYHGAIQALPALVFAATCEGLQRAAGVGADLARRTGVWAVASAVTLVMGLALAAVLVPRLGIAGAGLAWVVANALTTIPTYWVARQSSGIVLPVGRALGIVTAGGFIATLAAFEPWPVLGRLALLGCFGFTAFHLMRVRWTDLRSLLGEPARP